MLVFGHGAEAAGDCNPEIDHVQVLFRAVVEGGHNPAVGQLKGVLPPIPKALLEPGRVQPSQACSGMSVRGILYGSWRKARSQASWTRPKRAVVTKRSAS